MNITFLTNSLGFGGAAKMLSFVASSLSQRGHFITIINLHNTRDNSVFQDVDKDINIYDVTEDVKKKGHFGVILYIYRIVKKEKSQVIIGFTEWPNLYARLISWMLRIPSIMSERGDPVRNGMGIGVKNKISLAIINMSDGGVFQTQGAKDFYNFSLKSKSTIIANPIYYNNSIEIKPFEQRENSIISVGRLDNTQKRYDVMIKAFSIFSQRHPEYILKIYGEGEDEIHIQKWIEQETLNDTVKMMGFTDKPMNVMNESKIFLISSDYEGISNSLLEAMAMGLACVSTDHAPGGARYLIKDHENGLLVPIGDPNKMADALSELADNPNIAKRIGSAAKEVAIRFSPEEIINQWETYISTIIHKKQRHPNHK